MRIKDLEKSYLINRLLSTMLNYKYAYIYNAFLIPRIFPCRNSLVGLLAVAECEDPRLESEVVFDPKPGHPWCSLLESELRFKRKPWGVCDTAEVLYQSGIFNFWRDLWTRSWCSDITRSPVPFWSSFSGGWKDKTPLATSKKIWKQLSNEIRIP